MQVHCLERGFQNALVEGGLVPGKDLLKYRFEWRAQCSGLPKEWGVTHATDMSIWFWGDGPGNGLTDDEKTLLQPWNKAFADFVSGKEVHIGTQKVTDVMRLRSDGQTDVWNDDRWDEGLKIWDIVNDDKVGIAGWLRSKL